MEHKFSDTSEELNFKFKEIIRKLDEIIKIKNEKKLQDPSLVGNRSKGIC